MLTVLSQTGGSFVAVCVSKKLTSSDFTLYSTLLKDRITKYGIVHLYFEMSEFDGWEIDSFIKNAVFDLFYGRRFGKVAMIGDKYWQRLAAKVASPVKRYGIRYFDLKDREYALKWVLE